MLGVVGGLLSLGHEAVAVYSYLTLSISDATVFESNFGSTAAQFIVTLSAQSSDTVTVSFLTVDGTAHSPDDYTARTGTLTFRPGETVHTISVHVKGDLIDEPNETFSVDLYNSTNAFIGDGEGQGTIIDNDPPPSIFISDTQVIEANLGKTPATFSVSLSGPSGRIVSVDYTTADGTARAPSDYFATQGTVTFLPGMSTATVTIYVKGDTTRERDEHFFVNLSFPLNGVIVDGRGVGVILNDDT